MTRFTNWEAIGTDLDGGDSLLPGYVHMIKAGCDAKPRAHPVVDGLKPQLKPGDAVAGNDGTRRVLRNGRPQARIWMAETAYFPDMSI